MKASAVVFVAVLLLTASPVAAAGKPNVVFILADDFGQRDLGCYGSTFYETPNLDRIAREGARFTDAYAACPVCSPTRASLMTGLWPQRTGITDFIAPGGGNGPEKWNRNTILLPAPNNERLSLDSPTLAKAMKSAGYATFFAGKWHLGPEGFWPENQGFDINMGGTERGAPSGTGRYFSPYGNPRLPDGPPGEHLPDRLATETTKFIEANKEKPFFAYLSFYSVHTPLMARADLQKKYEEKRARLGLPEKWGREHTRDVRLVQNHAIYAAMIEAMDQAIGKVLAKLDEIGQRDNTLVIFTSDNGGLSTSEGWPTSNLPLRGGKGWMYEGGIREPFLVRWPAVVKPNRVIHTPVSSPDIFPTLLEVAGSSPLPGQKLDGVSLLPVFRGESLPERALFWHYPHYGNQGGAPGAAIRRGDWKLIEWFEDRRVELFNVVADVGETTDLAQRETARADALRSELHRWQKEVGAIFPAPNPKYDLQRPSGRFAARTATPPELSSNRPPARPPLPLRVIVETDAGGDPDDEQSLVRFLLYVSEWDVEGIIAARPTARDGENENTERTGLGILRRMLRAYGDVFPSLVHHDSRYPTPEQLRARTVAGYGGDDGVNLILKAVDADDPRPVWFLNWGTDQDSGESSLKRALDRVLAERGREEYVRFKKKLRLSSADRFGEHTTAIDPPFPLWVDTFRPEVDRKRWYHRFSGITARAGGFDVQRDVLNGHGPLGALYPLNTTHPQKEGDTMTFLYLVPTGMNAPDEPTWGSWAGRYGLQDESSDRQYYWANQPDTWNKTTHRDNSLARFAEELQNDFRARLDWCVKPFAEANHAPIVRLAGDRRQRVKSGATVEFDASATTDPDKNSLTYRWWIYPEPGTFRDEVLIEATTPGKARLVAPKVDAPKTLHVMLTVTDDGSPPLSQYARAVLSVTND